MNFQEMTPKSDPPASSSVPLSFSKISTIFWANYWRQIIYSILPLITLVLFLLLLKFFIISPNAINDPSDIHNGMSIIEMTLTLVFVYCMPLFWSLKKTLTLPYKDFDIKVSDSFLKRYPHQAFQQALTRFFTAHALFIPLLNYICTMGLDFLLPHKSELLNLLVPILLCAIINIPFLYFLFSFPNFFGFRLAANTTYYRTVI